MLGTLDKRFKQEGMGKGEQMNDLSIEAKLAILIRIAELIEQIRDPETLGGLRSVFGVLVKDLAFGNVH